MRLQNHPVYYPVSKWGKVGRELPQPLHGSITSTIFHSRELVVWPNLDAMVSGKLMIVFLGGCNRLGEWIAVEESIVLGCVKKSKC